MSENIVHTAIVDDCSRLARFAPGVCPAFKDVLEEHNEIARLGGVTRWGAWFVVDLLARFRDGWADRGPQSKMEQKLAFVLGWLFHRAADRQMKPLFRAADPGSPIFPTECSIYQDIAVFREVFGAGRREPYSPATLEQPIASHPGAAAFKAAEIEDFLRAVWQRSLLSLHTFIPDKNDVEAWMENLFDLRQRVLADIARYAEAYAEPDPDKWKRFVVDLHFYDGGDTLIRLARSLQSGAPEAGLSLGPAIESAESSSHYAQALAAGLGYAQAASRFFMREIGEAELRKSLHFAESERAPK